VQQLVHWLWLVELGVVRVSCAVCCGPAVADGRRWPSLQPWLQIVQSGMFTAGYRLSKLLIGHVWQCNAFNASCHREAPSPRAIHVVGNRGDEPRHAM
jgi:hypothetical protein